MVSKLAYVHQVVGHARHYLAGLMIVVESIRQTLEPVEHIRAHLGLYTHAHDMTVVLHEIIEQHTHNIDREQGDSEYHNKAILPVRNQVVEHTARDYRIDYSYERYQQRRAHIEKEQQLMRLVI